MALPVRDILQRIGVLLQDEDAVRWPLLERLDSLNDGLREIALLKPNAFARTVILPLIAGTRQSLPDAYSGLIGVTRMVTGTPQAPIGGRVVRTVPRESLDAANPYWHDPAHVPLTSQVRNLVYDALDPRSFHVYPGNDGTGLLEVIVALRPLELGAPEHPDRLDSYTAAIGLDDLYANALVDYGLYRAFSKDNGVPGGVERAALAYQQFTTALGLRAQAEGVVNPNRPPPAVGAQA